VKKSSQLVLPAATHFAAQFCAAASKLAPPMFENLAKFVPTVQPSSSIGVSTTSIISKVISVRVFVVVRVETVVGKVKVAVLVIVMTGVVLIVEVTVTRLTDVSVSVIAVDVISDSIVVVICTVKVELAWAVFVIVGTVAIHEQADETMLSATSFS